MILEKFRDCHERSGIAVQWNGGGSVTVEDMFNGRVYHVYIFRLDAYM